MSVWLKVSVDEGPGGGAVLALHKSHFAVYRVKNGDVEILRIHHVARDL